ncbi:uncharacterized protein [Diadema antillarum]|uniref:uncharacterized protein n=1 Tax=Diadema antillarum TaxID=105358 RepID=UPI003A879FFD
MDICLTGVAREIYPEEWLELGVRLGFKHSEIEQKKKDYNNNTEEGISKMLSEWMVLKGDVTHMEARQYLSDVFRAMNKLQLAKSLLQTAFGYIPPYQALGDERTVDFKYDVREFRETEVLSFECMLTVKGHPLPKQQVTSFFQSAQNDPDFYSRLCQFFHELNVRLLRISLVGNQEKSQLSLSVRALDTEGVDLVRRNLTNPTIFGKSLKTLMFGDNQEKVVAEFIFDRRRFEDIEASFHRQDQEISSGQMPKVVSDIEIVGLAHQISNEYTNKLGYNLGIADPEISSLKANGTHTRTVTENILFKWKDKSDPDGDNRTHLAFVLEKIGLKALGIKIREGRLRETKTSEERGDYLRKFSVPLRALTFPKTKESRQRPRGVVDPASLGPATGDCRSRQGDTGVIKHEEIHDTCRAKEGRSDETKEPVFTDLERVQTPAKAGRRTSQLQPANAAVRRRIVSAGQETSSCQPENPPRRVRSAHVEKKTSQSEASRRRVVSAGDQGIAVNLQRSRLASYKRLGETTIPALYKLDLSVIDDNMWEELKKDGITRNCVYSLNGLTRLAAALSKRGMGEIADYISTALMKDQAQQTYIKQCSTGSVTFQRVKITNQDNIDTTGTVSLEDVITRTHDREFPARLFLEARFQDDQVMIAKKLGYDWANTLNAPTPLANADLLFILEAGTIIAKKLWSIGDAILFQCLGGDELGIASHRVEEYLACQGSENIIVITGDRDAVAELMRQSDEFRHIIIGRRLQNCIVVMTTSPPEGYPQYYAHYRLTSCDSIC